MTGFHLEIDSVSARHGWTNCRLVLDGSYHTFLESEENRFDLRTLPLDR